MPSADENALKALIAMSTDDHPTRGLKRFKDATFCCGALPDGVATADRVGEVYVVIDAKAQRIFHIDDPGQAMMPNQWQAFCNPSYGGAVTEVKLMYADLKGELPTSIDDLASLTSLELSSNSITKTKDLYRMPALQVLDLSGNPLAPHSGYWRRPGSVTAKEFFEKIAQIGGGLAGGTGASTLRVVNLFDTGLTGPLPPLDRFLNLKNLNIANNNINGELPTWGLNGWGDLAQLEHLSMSMNLLEGPLPGSLARLEQLVELDVSGNRLSGPLVDVTGMRNLKKLLASGGNQFEGPMPDPCPSGPAGGPCAKNVEQIHLAYNRLNGTIPAGLQHLPHLTELVLAHNRFDSIAAGALGGFLDLDELDLSHNDIVADIGAVIGGLKDRSYISKLSLQNNRFTGALPASMREFKRAGEVSLGSNAITGGLPYLGPDAASGHLGAESLATLDVSNNRLTGAISNVSCLPRLRSLYLSRNQLTGGLYLNLCECATGYDAAAVARYCADGRGVRNVYAEDNRLDTIGSLPKTIAVVDIDRNLFAGPIAGLGLSAAFEELTNLEISRNSFTGSLGAVGELPALETLKAEGNQLEGGLALPNAINLKHVELQNNKFSGVLQDNPFWCKDRAFASLKNLWLDFSGNAFTGAWPACTGAAPNWLSGSKVELRLADNAFESSQSRPFFFTDSKVLPYVSYLDISRNGNMAGDRLQWIQKMGTQITLAYLKPKALLMSGNDIDADFSDVVNWLPATLEYLDISKNEFVGSVGDAVVSRGLGRFKYLRRFDARSNYLIGQLDSLQNLVANVKTTNVPRLDILVSRNLIQGNLDWMRENYEDCHIQLLDVAHNRLSGELPQNMHNLPVTRLLLNGNQFTGPIPVLRKLCAERVNATESEALVLEALQRQPDLNMSAVEQLLHLEQAWLNATAGYEDWQCMYDVNLAGNTFDCPAPSTPPGTNKRPWVNEVYQTADCTCQPGGVCRGNGGARVVDNTSIPYWLAGDGLPLSTDQGRLEECRAFCRPCRRGFSGKDEADVDGCVACESGKYSDEEGMAVCDGCPPGRKGNGLTGQTNRYDACDACNVSEYQDEVGMFECKPAPKGAYAPFLEMPAALPCPNGTYNDAVGATECTWCPRGKYAEDEGNTACQTCAYGEVTYVPGSARAADCKAPKDGECPPGFYADFNEYLQDMTKLICHSTPPGMVIGPVEEVCQGDNLCRVQAANLKLPWKTAVTACPGNTVNPGWNNSGCQVCDRQTYPNEADNSTDPPTPAKVFCVECDLFGTQSEHCKADWVWIGLAGGCVSVLGLALLLKFACCAKHFCFDEAAEKGGADGAAEKHTDHKEKKKKHHHKKHHHHDADPKLDP